MVKNKKKQKEPPKKPDFEVSKESDLENSKVPKCLYWSVDEVCRFFAKTLKLPDYQETLRSNGIDGRRLIYLDASHLPQIGIQDFEHILLITKSVRDLLTSKNPYWNRSISLPPKENLELYLEAKSFTGAKSNKLNYKEFKPATETENVKWQPPLTNQGFILPSF